MRSKLTTKEAAVQAGVTVARIRQLLLLGKVKGEKWGRDWVVSKASLKQWMSERDG